MDQKAYHNHLSIQMSLRFQLQKARDLCYGRSAS